MPIPEVVFQIDFSTKTVLKQGVVLDERADKGVDVRWSDGRVEAFTSKEFASRRLTRTPEGGLVHLQWSDPARRAALAAKDPAETVERILRGSLHGTTVTKLRQLAKAEGVPGTWLDANLAATIDSLVALGRASKQSKKIAPAGVFMPETQALLAESSSTPEGTPDESADSRASVVSLTATSPLVGSPSHSCPGTSTHESGPAAESTTTEADSHEALTTPVSLDPAELRALFARMVKEPMEERSAVLARQRAKILDAPTMYIAQLVSGVARPSGIEELRSDPVGFIRALSSLPAAVVAEASRVAAEPLARTLLAAYPQESRAVPALAATAHTGETSSLAGEAEATVLKLVTVAGSSDGTEVDRAALRHLVKRAMPVLVAGARAAALVAILDAGSSALPRTEDRATALGQLAAMLDSAWGTLGQPARRRLADVAASFDLIETRARRQLIASVHRIEPAAVSDDHWWAGVSLRHLLGSDNILASALADPLVVSRQIRPRLDRALIDVSSRRALFEILGGARAVVVHLDPAQVGAAFDRIARQDEVLGRWAAEVTRQAQRDELQERYDELKARSEGASDTLARAQREIERMGARVEKAEIDAHNLRHGQEELRRAEQRQLKIDAMRSLARLMRQLDSTQSATIEQIRGRALLLVSRDDIHPIGDHGEIAAFDPGAHTSVDTSIRPGDDVIVRVPGYVWAPHAERVVLLRADVDRPQV